jgi:hypothetical protein
MLLLNTIFQAEGLDPNRIQLIRHKDARLKGKTLYDVWHSQRAEFEAYQSVQGPKNSFEIDGLVASFVATRLSETIFVGIYKTVGRRHALEGERLSVLHYPADHKDFIHDLQLQKEAMVDYIGRLVIEPWKDAINFVHRASARNPKVLEIKRSQQQEPFPGPLEFSRKVNDLADIFSNWRERLTEYRGVYLLTFDDGHQYVGSASGNEGFWKRWQDYVKDGTGGNQVLIRDNRDARKDGTISILEVTGSALTREQIIAREMIWQNKLGSRAKRLEET